MTKLVPSILMRFEIELAHPNDEPEQHCWYSPPFASTPRENDTDVLQVVCKARRAEHEAHPSYAAD